MPQISKKVLSQYIRTGCMRQLALDLFPDTAGHQPDRDARSMPHRQSPRPGLRNIQAAGDDWAEEKMDDLTQTFGQPAIIGDRYTTPSNHVRYRTIQLSQYLTAATPIQFIVEAEFPVGGNFQAALGIADYHARFGVV